MPDETIYTCPGCGVEMRPWEFEYREICVACKHYEEVGSWSIEQAIELGDFKPKALAHERAATDGGG